MTSRAALCLLFLASTLHAQNIVRTRPSLSAHAVHALAKFEPDTGRVYHGVGGSAAEADAYRAVMDSTTLPYLSKLYFELPGSGAPPYAALRAALATERAAGRFPELSIDITNGTIGSDSILATTTQYDAMVDSLAAICKGFGRRIFIRPGFEFNGPWNGYHADIYPKAFKKIVDRFRAAGAGDSAAFIWCYYSSGAPNDFDQVDASGSRWYPGDGYVDWFGIDLFFNDEFDISLPENDASGITTHGKVERFLEMARTHGKPVLASEVSAAGMNITPDSAKGVDIWYNWFAPFFEFLSAHEEVKGFCYINTNWGGTWGDARIDSNATLASYYVDEMLNPWYIHLNGDTATPPPPPALTAPILAAPANNTSTTNSSQNLQWQRDTLVPIYHVQLSTSNTFATLLVDDSTVTAGTRPVGPLPLGRYYWRVRAERNAERGPWSDVWNFRIDLSAPSTVQLVYPAPSEVISETSATLVWRAASPAIDRYEVSLAENAAFAGAAVDSAVTDTFALRTGLQDGHTYFWRARAHNSSGWSGFSETRAFKVSLEPSSVPTAIGPGGEDRLVSIAPNPVQQSATITFSLARGGEATIALFDELGRQVRTVASDLFGAGTHSTALDMRGLPPGAYACRLSTPTGSSWVSVRCVR
ncbi:MAG: hypothetical protein JST22_19860 [Bacteroidetes bacterium]|nr:hypothetical protein [Bacteroidota bacterium]